MVAGPRPCHAAAVHRCPADRTRRSSASTNSTCTSTSSSTAASARAHCHTGAHVQIPRHRLVVSGTTTGTQAQAQATAAATAAQQTQATPRVPVNKVHPATTAPSATPQHHLRRPSSRRCQPPTCLAASCRRSQHLYATCGWTTICGSMHRRPRCVRRLLHQTPPRPGRRHLAARLHRSGERGSALCVCSMGAWNPFHADTERTHTHTHARTHTHTHTHTLSLSHSLTHSLSLSPFVCQCACFLLVVCWL